MRKVSLNDQNNKNVGYNERDISKYQNIISSDPIKNFEYTSNHEMRFTCPSISVGFGKMAIKLI